MENKYYIVRADRAGVFFGKIKERAQGEVTMTDVRKIWYWDGACAVEQLAMDGTKAPRSCKLTVEVPEIIIANPIIPWILLERASRALQILYLRQKNALSKKT